MSPQRNTVADLKRQLGEAKRAGDVTGEIATLLAMGKPLPKDPDLAFLHYRLAEKVILRAGTLPRLHEALGGQGREHRRRKRFDEAIERYPAAGKRRKTPVTKPLAGRGASARKGRSPASISYSTTPKDHKSVRESTCSPSACSGDL
jgi:hypothetical protein